MITRCLHLCRVATMAAWLSTTAGCARKIDRRLEPTAPAPDIALVAAPGPAQAPTHATIGWSLEGRSIECVTVGHGEMTVLLIATIHGDEPAGTPLLERLGREAAAQPAWMLGRRLLLIPLANPDGHASQRRGNARAVDLNRNFPAASFTSHRRHGPQPLSEPESRALHDLILAQQPQRIISLHQPLACIDFDGDGAGTAHVMADAIAPPHRLPVRKLGAYPGSLGSFAGEDLGIPIVTVEFPAGAHRLSDDELWSRYGAMLVAAIAQP